MEKSMKVALIEAKQSRNDYVHLFDNEFEFDQYQLCSDPSVKKVLKSNSDIDIDIDAYDWVILVGSEPTKFFTKVTAVTTYSGKIVEDKFIPMINPAMLAFKPEAKNLWESTRSNIIGIIKGDIQKAVIDETVYEGVNTEKRAIEIFKEALEHDSSFVGLDSETTGLYPRDGEIVGISLCFDGKKGYYIDADVITEEVDTLARKLWSIKKVVFHNSKFDIAMMEYHFNWDFPDFEDTMLLHYLINEQPGTHGLKELALHFTPYGDYEKPLRDWVDNFCKKNRIKKGDFNYGWIPFDVMVPYASLDALCTYLLYDKFKKIKQNQKLKNVYDTILIPGVRCLLNLQDNGVPFDIDRLEHAQKVMQDEIDKAYEGLMSLPEVKKFSEDQGADFNPNSPVQLRKVLFDYVGLEPTGKKTATGAISTDKEVLAELSEVSEIPKQILTVRTKGKIKNTYLDKIIPQLDMDSRLRTNFNLHSTTSGRLSSSGKLNMQQIPRDDPTVKGCIKARPGWKIVAMDLQTAEVYCAAVLSDDEALMDVFRSGGDFHSSIAKQVFNLPCEVEDVKEYYPLQRQAAKAVSFGIMYGAGPYKIAEQVSKDSGKPFSVNEAKKVIAKYFKKYYKLERWIQDNQKFIYRNAFIYSHFGRKRRLVDVRSTDRGISGNALRSGLNFLVQSVASDVNLLGCIEMEQYVRAHSMKTKIFALVHDSILAEVPEDEVEEYTKALTQCIQRDRGVSIPGCPINCDFDVGDDYSFGKFEKEYPGV